MALKGNLGCKPCSDIPEHTKVDITEIFTEEKHRFTDYGFNNYDNSLNCKLEEISLSVGVWSIHTLVTLVVYYVEDSELYNLRDFDFSLRNVLLVCEVLRYDSEGNEELIHRYSDYYLPEDVRASFIPPEDIISSIGTDYPITKDLNFSISVPDTDVYTYEIKFKAYNIFSVDNDTPLFISNISHSLVNTYIINKPSTDTYTSIDYVDNFFVHPTLPDGDRSYHMRNVFEFRPKIVGTFEFITSLYLSFGYRSVLTNNLAYMSYPDRLNYYVLKIYVDNVLVNIRDLYASIPCDVSYTSHIHSSNTVIVTTNRDTDDTVHWVNFTLDSKIHIEIAISDTHHTPYLYFDGVNPNNLTMFQFNRFTV